MNLAGIEKMLLIVPHPDDEILGCTSVIRWAVLHNLPYKIVLVTNGDADLLGALVANCQENLQTYGDHRVGVCKYLTKTAKGLQMYLLVYVETTEGTPKGGVRLKVTNEKNPQSAHTNQLGWVLMEISPGNILPAVEIDIEHGLSFRVKNVFNPAFFAGYGARRLEETQNALRKLGVLSEHIEKWGFKDGTLFDLQNHPSGQPTPLRVEVSRVLQEFAGGAVFIPHPLDIDPDHRALAELVLELSTPGDQTRLYKYLIHPAEEHRHWPEPAYQAAPTDRLAPYAELQPPAIVQKERIITVPLSAVGMDGQEKLGLIQQFQSQLAVDEWGFLLGFAKENELFYK